MHHQLSTSLDHFIEKFLHFYKQQNKPLESHFDELWVSPCQQGEIDETGNKSWAPCLRQEPADFSGIEHALDIQLHDDIKTFYSRYWCAGLDAKTLRGGLQLLQIWNTEDFERLLENLIGHVMMKKRLKQRITLFFAVTDEDDHILSLDNESGKVMLEQVGLEPREVISDSLAEFLDSLTPVIVSE